VLEELREESREKKIIRKRSVCVCVGVRERECVYECVRGVERRE
jgi:hypothetical protein